MLLGSAGEVPGAGVCCKDGAEVEEGVALGGREEGGFMESGVCACCCEYWKL